MGTFPSGMFESVQAGAVPQRIPVWKLRVVMAVASLLGLVIFLLLLPLMLFALLLVIVGIGIIRLRLWIAGFRGRGGAGVEAQDGRENVRVLVRDA